MTEYINTELAGTGNILIYQGSTFELTTQWKTSEGTPVDLTDYEITGGIAKCFEADAFQTISCETLVASAGQFKLTISASDTAEMEPLNSDGCRDREQMLGFWDVKVINTSTGVKRRIMEGKAYLSLEAGE